MSYVVTQAYEEVLEKGSLSVSQMIEETSAKLKGLAGAPMAAFDSALAGVVSRVAEMVSPLALASSELDALAAAANGAGSLIGEATDTSRATTRFNQFTRSAAATDELLEPGEANRSRKREQPASDVRLGRGAGALNNPTFGEAAVTQAHGTIEHAIRHEMAFVGLAQLADKMQIEAGRQAQREEALALQEQQNQHLGMLAGTVSGNVVNVAIQDAGAAARPAW
jgi:hypothetical protein